ncbi:AAA family ATPase [Treponema sp.]|uniref:AAA family ATPase n=1 Tax=Treponema sp. TaxID=166 RepID=UPI003F0B287C
MTLDEDTFNKIYNSFNERFPIEKLAEMKLDEYSNLKKDSFCYWVETKTVELGNIKGSTSYKFGIYEYNQTPRKDGGYSSDEKYAWVSKYGNTAEKVFDVIRSNIIRIANYSRAGEYEKIDEIDISEMFKWKVAFLYSEKKLINWFSKEALIEFSKYFGNPADEKSSTSELQNFLINKKSGKTLFEFDKILQQIWDDYKVRNHIQGASSMTNEKLTEYKELLLENHNLILHGAPGTGKTHLAKEIAEAMNAEVGFCQFHPSYDYTDFVEGLRPVSSDESGQICFKRMDGVFKEFCRKALENLEDSKKTVIQIKKELSWKDEIIKFLDEAMENKTKYQLKNNGFVIIENYHDDIIDILLPNNEAHNSDKIHISKLLKILNAEQEFDKPIDIEKYLGGYHSAEYSYILAIYKGIKEKKKNISDLDFESVSKIEKKNFVFIIDEINRGELSKIFGELFFSIDPGYRGLDENGTPKGLVTTQYQNLVEDTDPFKKGFFVPDNVYIIGTMNDIDRSVESMDFAMRRRFLFKEVTADESAENMNLSDEATETMKRINDQISQTEGLGSAYHIGGAYFRDVIDFEKLWKLKLSSLVKEYLRGLDDDGEAKFKSIENAYFNQSQDDFVQGN